MNNLNGIFASQDNKLMVGQNDVKRKRLRNIDILERLRNNFSISANFGESSSDLRPIRTSANLPYLNEMKYPKLSQITLAKKLHASIKWISKYPCTVKAPAAIINAVAGNGKPNEANAITIKSTAYLYTRRYDRKNASIG